MKRMTVDELYEYLCSPLFLDEKSGNIFYNYYIYQYPANQEYEMRRQIQEFKQKQIICARCGEPISDVISALADRETGNPVHFDCVLDYLRETEHIKENESITYIGQGRFAVVVFENPHDLRYFTIVRVIEWEPRDKQYEWRTQIAGLYSQIH